MPELILASRSPRRSALLNQLGISHRTLPTDVDEIALTGESPEDYVQRLSIAKATVVAARYPGAWVLGSDTAVILGQRILGKPADRDDAIAMLCGLGGRSHRVLTGVALVNDRREYRLSESVVGFRPISPDEAAAYWASGEPTDKAGAYAIQGRGAAFVNHLSGSYSGVMGLPLFEVAAMLGDAGFTLFERTPGKDTRRDGN